METIFKELLIFEDFDIGRESFTNIFKVDGTELWSTIFLPASAKVGVKKKTSFFDIKGLVKG